MSPIPIPRPSERPHTTDPRCAAGGRVRHLRSHDRFHSTFRNRPLRDPIPAKEVRNFVSVDGSQRVEPVDTRDDASCFELVKSACRQRES
jgi:hypothetical protein